MKYTIVFFLLMSVIHAHANSCRTPSRGEVEVIYVNGILTDYTSFENNVTDLSSGILNGYKFSASTSVHNPTWGATLDVIQSLAQLEQNYLRDNSHKSVKDMRVDMTLVAYQAISTGIAKEMLVESVSESLPKALRDFLSIGESFEEAMDKLALAAELTHTNPLGNEASTKLMIEQYTQDAVKMFEQHSASSSLDIAPNLSKKIFNLFYLNKPFILLGHSQGTIIVNQAYRILKDDANGDFAYKNQLFGKYEIASMNPWSSSDFSDPRADYMVLHSDRVQDGVDIAMRFQSRGAIDPVNETDPFVRHYQEDAIASGGIEDNDLYYSFSRDATGHGLQNYVKAYPRLSQRSIERLDYIRRNLRVCDEPKQEVNDARDELNTCPSDVFFHNKTSDRETIRFNAGQKGGAVTFNATGLIDVVTYLNGVKVSDQSNRQSIYSEFFVNTQENHTSNNEIVFDVRSRKNGTSWNLDIFCPR